MDRERADFDQVLRDIAEVFEIKPLVLTLPIGAEDKFAGVVDILKKKAYLYEKDGSGKFTESDIPADMQDTVEEIYGRVVEDLAEVDDALMEKYFETETLSDDEIKEGMRAAAKNPDLNVVPVFVTSSTHSIGIVPLLEALIVYVAPPSERRVSVEAERGGEIEFLEGPLSDSGPTVAYVFHSHTDKYGTLTYFRLFNGMLKPNLSLIHISEPTRPY